MIDTAPGSVLPVRYPADLAPLIDHTILRADARAADVALMRRTVRPGMGAKASGGIRTFEQAAAIIAAGATRIGA